VIRLSTPDPFGIYSNPIGHWVVVVVAMVVLAFVLVTATAYVVYFERVALGWMQRRPGPNRVGPFGLLQLAADGVKGLTKEGFSPVGVDPVLFVIAPGIAVGAVLLGWAVIPVGIWGSITYWIADLNIGILLVLAVSSMNIYAIMLGGWASNNKYSLLGGMRAAAQLISYEMAMGLSLVPIFMIVGSLRLQDIVGFTVHWGGASFPLPLIVLAPVSFLIYLVAAVAETNRAPFDLPEAEQELIGGFLTEYSGFKFFMFYLAEYLGVLTQATLIALLFFGGWNLPLIPGAIALLLKVVLLVFLFVWVRGTLPRLRYDMLMRFGWKVLLPLGLANVIVTSVLVVLLT
jgi:NADH-quinone oxidoreductase subunit H